MEDDQKQLNLNLRPEIVGGSYSNLAVISHSKTEFVIDFAAMLPGLNGPQVTNRIIMSPEHTKKLLFALQDNISKYEQQYGAIDDGMPKGTFNLSDIPGFGNIGGNGPTS